jgi:hypothetical protein
MVASSIITPLESIVFGAVVSLSVLEVVRWSGVSTTLVTLGLYGMAQRGLGGRSVMMDMCGVEVSSDAMVASMAGLVRAMRISVLKMAHWFNGGDGFRRVCMRCSLRVCLTR